MFEILAFLNSIKYVLLAVGAAIIGIWYKIQQKRVHERDRTIEELQKAKKVYEAKDEITEHDDIIEQEVDSKTEALEEKIKDKPNDQVAEIVSSELDNYFKDEKK